MERVEIHHKGNLVFSAERERHTDMLIQVPPNSGKVLLITQYNVGWFQPIQPEDEIEVKMRPNER